MCKEVGGGGWGWGGCLLCCVGGGDGGLSLMLCRGWGMEDCLLCCVADGGWGGGGGGGGGGCLLSCVRTIRIFEAKPGEALTHEVCQPCLGFVLDPGEREAEM